MHHDRSDHPHEEAVLNIMSDPTGRTHQNLRILEEKGFARQISPTLWSLTSAGVARARALLDKRLGGDPDTRGENERATHDA